MPGTVCEGEAVCDVADKNTASLSILSRELSEFCLPQSLSAFDRPSNVRDGGCMPDYLVCMYSYLVYSLQI